METTPKNFTYKVSDEKTLDAFYFFNYNGVNKGSGYINFTVQTNDPDTSQPLRLSQALPESTLNSPHDELVINAESLLDDYYKSKN
ncbi:MAG: hypothetical protein WCF67_23605 [Chitinophagaceae bacterium]